MIHCITVNHKKTVVQIVHVFFEHIYNPSVIISPNNRSLTLKANICCAAASVLVLSVHCVTRCLITVSQPGKSPSFHSLRPTHPPGDSVFYLDICLGLAFADVVDSCWAERKFQPLQSPNVSFFISLFWLFFFTTWKKRRFSFMNYRNQICVPLLPSECRQMCLLCIDFGILSVKGLVLWETPVFFDYSWVKAEKSLKSQTYTCTATCTPSRWLIALSGAQLSVTKTTCERENRCQPAL